MLRALLTLLVALVCFSTQASAVSFMPPSCVDPAKLKELLLSFRESGHLREYTCTADAQSWTIKREHVAAVLIKSKIYAGFALDQSPLGSLTGARHGINRPLWSGKSSDDGDYWVYVDEYPSGNWINSSWGVIGQFGNRLSAENEYTYSDWQTFRSYKDQQVRGFVSSCLYDAAQAYQCGAVDFYTYLNDNIVTAVNDNATGVIDIPDPDAGTGGGTGGGTWGTGTDPYAPGSEKSLCGNITGLSVIEKVLFKVFQPCQDWVKKFQDLNETAKTKQPLGYFNLIDMQGMTATDGDFEVCLPNAQFNISMNNNVSIPCIDVARSEPGKVFHEKFRPILIYILYFFIAMLAINKVTR